MKQLVFIVAALALVATFSIVGAGAAQAEGGCYGDHYTAGTQTPVQTVQVPAPEPKSGS